MKHLLVLLPLLFAIGAFVGCSSSSEPDTNAGTIWNTLQLGSQLTFEIDGLDSNSTIVPGAAETETYTVDSVDLQVLGSGSRYLSSTRPSDGFAFVYDKDGDIVWTWARFAAGPRWVTLPFRSRKPSSIRIDTTLSFSGRYVETMTDTYVAEERTEVADTSFVCSVVRQCYSGRAPDRSQFKYDSIATLYYYAPSLGFIVRYDERTFKVDSTGSSYFSYGQRMKLVSYKID